MKRPHPYGNPSNFPHQRPFIIASGHDLKDLEGSKICYLAGKAYMTSSMDNLPAALWHQLTSCVQDIAKTAYILTNVAGWRGIKYIERRTQKSDFSGNHKQSLIWKFTEEQEVTGHEAALFMQVNLLTVKIKNRYDTFSDWYVMVQDLQKSIQLWFPHDSHSCMRQHRF